MIAESPTVHCAECTDLRVAARERHKQKLRRDALTAIAYALAASSLVWFGAWAQSMSR